MEKERILELANYFIDNGIHVVALTPGKKYPNYKNWQTVSLSKSQISRAINNGYGLGIVPHNNFIVVDLDVDHEDNVNGKANFDFNFREVVEPLTAYKENSQNEHRFYQNTYNLDIRLTGNNAILSGVDIFTKDNLITTLPFYDFDNLDLTIPFIDQLPKAPVQMEQLHAWEHQTPKQENSKYRKHNIKNYLAKVEPFSEGGRSEGYRKLMFTMVIKNGMPYEDVYEAIRDWDAKTIDYQSEEPYQFEHAIREPK